MHKCHNGLNQKFYFVPVTIEQNLFVTAKLCSVASDEPPDPPICDVLQAGGESAKAVNEAMKGSGVAAFGFTPIPTSFAGEMDHGKPTFEQMYLTGPGMMLTQWGLNGLDCDGCTMDQCRHTRLFTTSVGCNVPRMPKGKEMSCVRFVKTTEASTPYGPIDKDANIKCTDKVLDTYSGWCECQPAEEGKGSVIHAVRSAKRNPIGKEYTCEEECKNPTWVPAISTLDMAETSANFDTIGNEDVLKHDQGAVCEKGFYDIEHLPVGAVGPLCVNLQSDLSWDMSGGAKAPPASKLCAKR